MANRKQIVLEVTPEAWQRAAVANSRSCLIADALKAQGYHRPVVDVATISFTDPKRGERVTYLTPEPAQMLLLAFDQGWGEPEEHQIRLRGPIKVRKVTRTARETATREQRHADLELKADAGELTPREQQSLTRLRQERKRPERQPRTRVDKDGTLHGGRPLPRVDSPNLLAGRSRSYGARLAQPSVVFQDTVNREVERRLAEQQGGAA